MSDSPTRTQTSTRRPAARAASAASHWDEVLEIDGCVANIYTAQDSMALTAWSASRRSRPCRCSATPLAAASCSCSAGINLSFYDWYCDLPTAFPEIWGEQTDVCESADWFNSKMIADMGACLNMTRTPDCHFFAESRHNGTKAVVFAPDFSQVCKYADQWVPLHAGSDGAFWMATTHVILKEFHHEKKTPYFLDYVKKYTDSPLLGGAREGRRQRTSRGSLLRAGEVAQFKDITNG